MGNSILLTPPFEPPDVSSDERKITVIDDASFINAFPPVYPPSNFSGLERAHFEGTSSVTTKIPSAANRGQKRKSASTGPVLEVPGKRLSVRLEQDSICEACHQIDFQRVLDLDSTILQSGEKGILIAYLGTRFALASSKRCTLCRLFAAVAIQSLDTDEPPGYELRA